MDWCLVDCHEVIKGLFLKLLSCVPTISFNHTVIGEFELNKQMPVLFSLLFFIFWLPTVDIILQALRN